MLFRPQWAILIVILMSGIGVRAQNPSNLKTKKVKTCETWCYGLILKGELIDTFDVLECNGISGMTCHVLLKNGARLPSRVFMQALDSHDKPTGKRQLLLYPHLKPRERGWATFLGLPNDTKTVVL